MGFLRVFGGFWGVFGGFGVWGFLGFRLFGSQLRTSSGPLHFKKGRPEVYAYSLRPEPKATNMHCGLGFRASEVCAYTANHRKDPSVPQSTAFFGFLIKPLLVAVHDSLSPKPYTP